MHKKSAKFKVSKKYIFLIAIVFLLSYPIYTGYKYLGPDNIPPGALRATVSQKKITYAKELLPSWVFRDGWTYLEHQPTLYFNDDDIHKSIIFSPDGTRVGFSTVEAVLIDNTAFSIDKLATYTTKFSDDSDVFMFINGSQNEDYSKSPKGSQLCFKHRNEDSVPCTLPFQEGDQFYNGTEYSPEDFNVGLGNRSAFRDSIPKTFVDSSTGIKAEIEVIYEPGKVDLHPRIQRLVILSPDGRQYNHSFLRRGPIDPRISHVIFDDTGERVAYIVGRTTSRYSRRLGAYVIVSDIDGSNTTHGEMYHEIDLTSLRFSDDGNSIVYGAHREANFYWIEESLDN